MHSHDHNHDHHDHDHDHDHNHVIALTDEEGNEVEFEVVANFQHEGEEYGVLVPLSAEEEEGATAYIFKIIEEGDEATFMNLTDEEFEVISQVYYDLVSEEE